MKIFSSIFGPAKYRPNLETQWCSVYLDRQRQHRNYSYFVFCRLMSDQQFGSSGNIFELQPGGALVECKRKKEMFLMLIFSHIPSRRMLSSAIRRLKPLAVAEFPICIKSFDISISCVQTWLTGRIVK